ncbi:endonuclease/exonuclease/phosphatase family protein [Brachybacterium sp. AOP25-B2-12]|uniref:endonuclease/exonuclease/phosphatase family protein n=1 Tax=Brachybacterium sp. AOP25-B2-12 TaxID=3457710 RepID=UPI004033EEE2
MNSATTPGTLDVLTQNVRNARSGAAPGGPDDWQVREPVLQDLLRTRDPDVVATQEVLLEQIPTLDRALPGHLRIGVGRDGGGRGEHTLLHLRRTRFTLLDWDQFWLSEEPHRIGSRSWGAACPRIAVWARVRDLARGAELVLAVTHLDHASEEARLRATDLLATRLADVADGLPIVLAGDFNAPAGPGGLWRRLALAGFADAHDAAVRRVGADIGTFPDYGIPVVGGERIDGILVRGLAVDTYAAHDHRVDGHPASDHAAVLATLRWP